MNAVEFLSELLDQGIQLWSEGDQLRYRAPAGALTEAFRSRLAAHKPEILEFLRTNNRALNAAAPPITPAVDRSRAPLSFAQERLWFIDQLQPGSTGYNMPGVRRIAGMLPVDLIERVVNEILRRHDVLRTVYENSPGGPVQVVQDWRPQELPVVDLAGLPGRERETEAARLVGEECRRPFNLRRGPVVRVTLLRCAADDHVIQYTLHHIASDGWSMGVLNREMSMLYEIFLSGSSSLPAPPKIQYLDFAVWQRNWLQGEVLQQQLGYWTRRLAGMVPLQLPTDRPRPALQSFAGAIQEWKLDPAAAAELKALSQREGLTLFMMLLAGLQVVLSRYCRQDDLSVGAAIANRNRPEVEGLIGFFVNTLVLRGDVAGDPTIEELLVRVKEMTLGAYEHQDLPFEKLVKELQPERDLSRNPLVQVALELLNTPDDGVELQGISLRPMDRMEARTRFDLEVHVREQTGGISGWITYSRDLFEPGTIARMARHFTQVLAAMAHNSALRLSAIDLLTGEERRRILEEWNDRLIEHSTGGCLHELFERQVKVRPEAVAVVSGDEQWTYGELNRKANGLARRLRNLGVGPEAPVAICLDRSVQIVIAVLATLKAGGAYVPLDPMHPADRQALIWDESGARVLVTRNIQVSETLGRGRDVVNLDLFEAEMEGTDGLGTMVSPENLAYILYTSGSTGTPKGVACLHRNVINLVEDFQRRQPILPGWRCSWWTALTFDVSAYEIFSALTAGGTLYIVPEDVRPDGERFIGWLADREIESAYIPPFWLRSFSEFLARPPKSCALRKLLVGVEPIPEHLLAGIAARVEGLQIVNGYGPTETTVCASLYWTGAAAVEDRTTPIGRPVRHSQIYLLDNLLGLLPEGVAGELYIGGAGVARGYIGRPDLTAERFIPDPYSHSGGGRLYRTGDRGRYLASGDIEFLGRIDHQVKMHGYRIEPGEIESALKRHPGVKESVVMVRDDAAGNRQLIGYVVTQDPAGAGTGKGEQVSEWQSVFEDHLYGNAADTGDPTFNIAGWQSSYTGQPIPADEMREWLDDTIARIVDLRPRRVLELGCGSGLVLFGVAPHCEEYWGSDFSGKALAHVSRHLEQAGLDRSRVKLMQRTADDLNGIRGQNFSGVVLNSIVQYFPDVEYLLKVLDGALGLVEDGGFIFLGDVRSLPLAEPFVATVQLARAADDQNVADVRQAVQQHQSHEKELLISPAFFLALQSKFNRIGRVEIVPKRGKRRNELMLFRYQVLLHVGPRPKPSRVEQWLHWKNDGVSVDTVNRVLNRGEVRSLGVRNIANQRLSGAMAVLELLNSSPAETPVGELRRKAALCTPEGIEPYDWESIARTCEYRIAIDWSRHGLDGTYDVVFWRGDRPDDETVPVDGEVWSGYANNPLRLKQARQMAVELKAYLTGQLPKYMVPAALVIMDRLPLTANGKVARAALPVPEAGRTRNQEIVAARNEVEEKLAGIWSEVLGTKRTGMHDDFFGLGGHSLLATQVISRVREAFQLDVPLPALFEHPTVAGLATQIAAMTQAGRTLPRVSRAPRNGRLPLSFAQERLWVMSQMAPESAAYNIPGAIRIPGQVKIDSLEWTVNEIVRRHEVLRTTFDSSPEGPVQVIHDAVSRSLPLVDLGAVAGTAQSAEAKRLLQEEGERPFDLHAGPIVRTQLLRLAPDDHVVLYTMHHIAGDGWSLGVLYRDMEALYDAHSSGKASSLPELAIQYADYSQWQRQWLTEEVLGRQLAYWRTKLERLPIMNLRRGTPPQAFAANGATQSFGLSTALCSTLKSVCEREDVTPFMLLLAVFQVLISHYTGGDDVVVGTDVANRTQLEMEALIGFFVNQLVLRTDLGGDPTFGEILQRVRETALGAYAHQDVPFERLVREFAVERDAHRMPLFQIKFVFQNAPVRRLGTGALVPETMRYQVKTARYDLMVTMKDAGTGWGGVVEYNTGLFDPAAIGRLLALYETGLQEVSREPQIRLSALRAQMANAERALMTEEQRRYREDRRTGLKKHSPIPKSMPASALREAPFNAGP